MDEFLTKSMKKTKRTGLLQEAWMPGLEATEFNLLDDADIDEGECQKCHKSSVTGDDHLWVGCDTCKRCYHWKCLGYKRRPSKKQKIRCVSISLLHHYLSHHNFGETSITLHADNCSGQNKNRFMMQYLASEEVGHSCAS